ncbi:MAG: MMPL family transporter, partial [Gammaproteobacteria bacterium]
MRISSSWLTLLGVALITVPALDRIFDFETLHPTFAIDPSIKALLPRDGHALRVFEETRDRYATDDYLLVAWVGDDLYHPQRLSNFKRLTKRVERLPGVDKVESIASAYNFRAREDVTEINAFLDMIPEDETGAKRIRDEALANPLYRGHLVSDDGRGITLIVHFDPTLSSEKLIALVDEIGLFSVEEANGIEQFLSGPLLVRLEVSRLMLRDLYRTMPIAVVATLIVALIGFRNVRGVVLPLLSNVVGLILSLACFVASGHTMNFITVILPPVIYVVGFAYAIHIISDFDRHFEKGIGREAAKKACVKDVFVPLTLTAFTTAVGFASLTVSDIE